MGSINLYDYSNDTLVYSFDLNNDVRFTGNILSFKLNTNLKYETKYYILIDSGTILYKTNKLYEGIQSKDLWSFMTKKKPDNKLTASISGSEKLSFYSDIKEVRISLSEYMGIKSVVIGGIMNPKTDFLQLIVSFPVFIIGTPQNIFQ